MQKGASFTLSQLKTELESKMQAAEKAANGGK
jgi:hypothetical protein